MAKRKKNPVNGTMELTKSKVKQQENIHPKALAAFRAGQGWLVTSAEEPLSRNYALDEALQAFERALEFQPDYLEAHLWIARLTHDRQTKRDHLEVILKHDAKHEEAHRMLADLSK